MFESLSHPKTEDKAQNPFSISNAVDPLVGFSGGPALPRLQVTEPLVLTNAERTIALLVAEGARNHDIARQLGVSHRTVESHLSNIFAKLGIGSRVQLALWISASTQTER